MLVILALGVIAFVLSLVITPITRDLFLKHNIVDHPDADRKFHLKPIPRIGGIPIVISYAGALGLVLLFAPSGAKLYVQHSALLLSLLPATALVFITGVLDDLIGLKPWQKLAGQVVAAVLAVSLGARMSIYHGPIWISMGISIIWLIGCSNAMNLIDGMDGLASGVGLLATGATLFAAILSGNLGLAAATVPLVGCLLAFLRYNFSPASIFLGDCGSLTLGFMLGCFGLIWSQRTGSLLGMAAPLMAFALPLVDVCLAIGRRFLRNRPIFKGDRGHIHHMVLALGFTPRSAALILYAVCGISASLALLQSFSRREFAVPIVIVFVMLAMFGIKRLGYVELRAAGRTFTHKTALRAVQEEIFLDELDRSLAAEDTLEGCWQVIRKTCNDLQFATVQMYLHGRFFEEIFIISGEEPSFRMSIVMGKHGSLTLTRGPESTPPKLMMAALIHMQHAIERKEQMGVQGAFRLTEAA